MLAKPEHLHAQKYIEFPLDEYMLTLQGNTRYKGKGNRLSDRIILFCAKFDLSENDYENLRDKVEKNQFVVI